MDGSFYASLSPWQAMDRRWPARRHYQQSRDLVWTGSAYVVQAAMAKAAVHATTMSLAVEWGPKNIRVNAICAAAVPTEGAWDKLNPLAETSVGATQADECRCGASARWTTLRNLLIFLMSDGCSYITGDTISIDGGHHLAAPSTFAGLSKLSPDDWRAREAIRPLCRRKAGTHRSGVGGRTFEGGTDGTCDTNQEFRMLRR